MFTKQKWIIISFYRSEETNIKTFLSELKKCIDTVLNKYENIIVMGDMNVPMSNSNANGFKNVTDFCDIFDLKNLVKSTTCSAAKTHSTMTDLVLYNREELFKNSLTIETGLSDHHQLVFTSLKTKISRLKAISINYRDHKKFDELAFLQDLKGAPFNITNFLLNDPNYSYIEFQDIFKAVVDRHAPLKTKEIVEIRHLSWTKNLQIIL